MEIHDCLLLFAACADWKYKGSMIEMTRWTHSADDSEMMK